MHQIPSEQIKRFMSGQVRCWNNHDKAGLLALYREAAPDLLDIEYVGRTQQADGWLVIEKMYDKHNHQFRIEVVSTIINGNEAMAMGLVTAARLADKPLVYSSYPITPA